MSKVKYQDYDENSISIQIEIDLSDSDENIDIDEDSTEEISDTSDDEVIYLDHNSLYKAMSILCGLNAPLSYSN